MINQIWSDFGMNLRYGSQKKGHQFSKTLFFIIVFFSPFKFKLKEKRKSR